MICVEDNFAGEKFIEDFQVIVDLRLTKNCKRKSF